MPFRRCETNGLGVHYSGNYSQCFRYFGREPGGATLNRARGPESTAVEHEQLAGEVRRGVAREKQRGPDDLVG